ncbi:MAG: response regulator [Deltaproteobacteria bacterium]|nr:response regulator [Deltaproteobacteria bacterium]
MNKSVLVVEDEAAVRRSLSRLLGERGFRTIDAANGREAIERLAAETPAAIIIDLLMPVMSGAELLKALRRNPFYRRIPTVVMTGALDSELSSVGQVLGVPVVFKPNLSNLPDLIISLIEKSAALITPEPTSHPQKITDAVDTA